MQLEGFVSLKVGAVGRFCEPQELCSWKVLLASRWVQLEDFVSLKVGAVGRFCEPQELCSWKVL